MRTDGTLAVVHVRRHASFFEFARRCVGEPTSRARRRIRHTRSAAVTEPTGGGGGAAAAAAAAADATAAAPRPSADSFSGRMMLASVAARSESVWGALGRAAVAASGSTTATASSGSRPRPAPSRARLGLGFFMKRRRGLVAARVPARPQTCEVGLLCACVVSSPRLRSRASSQVEPTKAFNCSSAEHAHSVYWLTALPPLRCVLAACCDDVIRQVAIDTGEVRV